MKIDRILAAVTAAASIIGGRDFTPQGQAISLLAHSIKELATGKKQEPTPNIAPIIATFPDADNDGIDDRVDADGGTVPAVTDEMIKAGLTAIDTDGPDFDGMTYSHWDEAGKGLVAAYLAMYAARPKNS